GLGIRMDPGSVNADERQTAEVAHSNEDGMPHRRSRRRHDNLTEEARILDMTTGIDLTRAIKLPLKAGHERGETPVLAPVMKVGRHLQTVRIIKITKELLDPIRVGQGHIADHPTDFPRTAAVR